MDGLAIVTWRDIALIKLTKWSGRFTIAFTVGEPFFFCRAMLEIIMLVANVVEPVHVALLEHESHGNGMHGSIAPSLIKEASSFVEILEVGLIAFWSHVFYGCNLWTSVSRFESYIRVVLNAVPQSCSRNGTNYTTIHCHRSQVSVSYRVLCEDKCTEDAI